MTILPLRQTHKSPQTAVCWLNLLLCPLLLWTLTFTIAAQTKPVKQKLPPAEKIVEKYLKAIGGKKRAEAVRDMVLEWSIELNGQSIGIAKSQTKAPSSWRLEMTFGNGEIVSAANGTSSWSKGLDGELRTFTGAEAAASKLQATLEASHLSNLKKNNIAGRVVSLTDLGSDAVFVVEFSTRSGGKLIYYFSRVSGLIVKVEDEARKTTTRFLDYRLEGHLLQPHQLKMDLLGTGELTLSLQKADYNTGIPASVFDPPRANETLDVAELLRAVGRNQDELESRFSEYSFLQKEIDREISSKGELKKETSRVYEVFPLANREPVLKLISENGIPLTTERAAKEEKRVQEAMLKAEREKEKDALKIQKRRAERQRKNVAQGKDEDEDVEISQFLKICEFVSPRLERFRGRDAVVFDFRPRPGFRPSNRNEDLISKLVGVVWIDPEDRQVMRLEARLAEGFKMAGGLLLSLRPGAAFVMEQTRMEEGIWLPRFAQINLSVRVLLFGGGDLNKSIEWSDYKHFKGDVGDYKLDVPNPAEKKSRP